MMNAFELLGLKPSLVVNDREVNDAFREAAKTAHPDAGGSDAVFADLRRAAEIVASPSRRLQHWLELKGISIERRGVVDPGLMELFAEVGETMTLADSLVRRRENARSALSLAMLERETHDCRERVERAISRVDDAIATEAAIFSIFEKSDISDVEACSRTARNLAFLEKWRAGLKANFARLV